MFISELQITNFRNFENLLFPPDIGLNVLVGDNAQGKTNLLEAIYVLAHSSSFRIANDRDLIRFGQEGFNIRANYLTSEKEKSIEVIYTSAKGKTVKLNNKKRFSASEKPRVTLFTPDDLFLLKGAPQGRRGFLDNIISQVSPEYLVHLDNYETLIKRRNSLLRSDDPPAAMLDAIDTVFVETAAQIVIARLNILKLLEEESRRYYQMISAGQGSLSLKYAMSFSLSPGKINLVMIKDALAACLRESREREIHRHYSLFGPHRDDINVYIDDKNARIYASQGQQRNVIVALKLAELEVIHKLQGTYPIFLLDEVLAELDASRKKVILQILQEAPFQTFLTSVEVSLFNDIRGKIIKVQQGKFDW
ncbi:MAG: DNA replication/repair protein RecF [Ignavibacteriales bacterium]